VFDDHEEAFSHLFLPEELFDITISGTEEEMLNAAVQHAIQAHGHRDTPALREELRAALRDKRRRSAA
jgi:hypothetical protein